MVLKLKQKYRMKERIKKLKRPNKKFFPKKHELIKYVLSLYPRWWVYWNTLVHPSLNLVYVTSHLSFVGFYSYLVSWLAMI